MFHKLEKNTEFWLQNSLGMSATSIRTSLVLADDTVSGSEDSGASVVKIGSTKSGKFAGESSTLSKDKCYVVGATFVAGVVVGVALSHTGVFTSFNHFLMPTILSLPNTIRDEAVQQIAKETIKWGRKWIMKQVLQ